MAPIFTTLSLSIFLFLHHISAHSLSHPTGFTANFIHREYSPLSPFYNPSHTKFDRLHNTIRRSFSRSSSSPNTIQSVISSIPGEYLMNISIGTPPLSILGIADTGSDLTWTQCQPCTQCFKQNSPLFDPTNSSTYKTLPCNAKLCAALGTSTCSSGNNCEYRYSYGDRSFTIGDLAVEFFTFGSARGRPVSIPNVVFGCGHENGGTFNETSSGIVGLGGGPLSIIRQLNSSVNGKFSYCLVPISEESETSKIKFGSNAVVSGKGVVSTPMLTKSPNTFYYLNLKKITVGGNKTIEYKGRANEGKDGDVEGNMIIDSGTTLTMLPWNIYHDLESKLKESVTAESTRDSEGYFSLCYKISEEGQDNLNIPTITFHFTDADLDLPASTTFLEVEEGLVCLMMIPNDELAIFGNLSQMGFLVGYDLVKKEVSFKRTDCSKQ